MAYIPDATVKARSTTANPLDDLDLLGSIKGDSDGADGSKRADGDLGNGWLDWLLGDDDGVQLADRDDSPSDIVNDNLEAEIVEDQKRYEQQQQDITAAVQRQALVQPQGLAGLSVLERERVLAVPGYAAGERASSMVSTPGGWSAPRAQGVSATLARTLTALAADAHFENGAATIRLGTRSYVITAQVDPANPSIQLFWNRHAIGQLDRTAA